jgi:hypothetical protein
MTKAGGVFFFFDLILIVFGVVSFTAEFVFGRPLMEFIKDFIFLVFRK